MEDGILKAKLDTASNCLAEGLDEEMVSRCTGLSMDTVRELKRNL